MTAGKSDFASLASASLPPVTGDSWNGYSGPTSQPSLVLNAANGGIDLGRIQQLSYALQAAPTTDASAAASGSAAASAAPTKFVSVQEIIHQRRGNIINKLFTDEMQKTRERCDKMHAMRMKKDWEEQKELYMKELVGDRRLGGSSNVTKFESITAGSAPSQSNLQYQINDHLRLVKDWNNKTDNISTIYEFSRLASKSPSYAAAWKLVYALQQRKTDSPLGRAIATMSHLGRQFRAHVENRVRSATATGQAPAESKYAGTAHTVATYVHLTVGSQVTHWATIFYCLRCGDFVGAKQVLDAHEPGHVLAATLEVYAKQQGPEPYFWDQVTFVNANPVAAHQQTTNNDFENACRSLLSGQGALGSSPLIKTIEDFMYTSLWHAIFGGTQPQEALVAIGARIKGLGPKHFQGDDSANCWSYAMPLLLAQQYRSSMVHLAEGNGEQGVLQAAHLSLFLPELQDLGEDSTQCLLTVLLVELASKLTPASASNALEYLIRIPDESQKRKKIVELIVETRQFKELAGALSADGVRRGEKAALDQHFPARAVCDLLEEAALLANARNSTRDALELLNLAERYASLLSLLNEKLASLLNQNTGDEKE